MKHFISNSIVVLLLFSIPLAQNINLILSVKILVLMVVAFLLLMTQPRFSLEESFKNRKTDNGTIFGIFAISIIGLTISIYEWSVKGSVIWEFNFINYLSIFLIISGITIRLTSIATLQNNFSSTVQIKKNQVLITTGIYKYCRHPSYLGAWLIMVSTALLLRSVAGIIILGFVMVWIYILRIRIEEKVLTEAFGNKYVEYQSNSWKMFPFIW